VANRTVLFETCSFSERRERRPRGGGGAGGGGIPDSEAARKDSSPADRAPSSDSDSGDELHITEEGEVFVLPKLKSLTQEAFIEYLASRKMAMSDHGRHGSSRQHQGV
jgi:hypothetical protein